MGNSIGPPVALPGGRITHELSGSVITVEQRDRQMIHLLVQRLTAEYPIAYQIGAGRVGYSYIVQIGSYLFESPASWYRSHGWDLSPGYVGLRDLDFDRRVATAFRDANWPRLAATAVMGRVTITRAIPPPGTS
jgi:hypothetical protein